MKNIFLLFLLVFVLSVFMVAPWSKADKSVISLAGEWKLKLDPDEKGESNRWFEASQQFSDPVKLPGSIQQQGYGTLNQVKDRSRLTPTYIYQGKAWFKRTITIPKDWNGKRAELFLERAQWETQVWVDEKRITENQDSLCSFHLHDLGLLTPGDHQLTICVNNQIKYPIGSWVHAITQDTQGNWNGIIGRIELRGTPLVWIKGAQVYSDKVLVKVGNQTGAEVEATILDEKVKVPQGGSEVTIKRVDTTKVWDEFYPVMQKLEVTLSAGEYRDAKVVSYGLRKLEAKNRQFWMNSRPIFLRGAVDEAIYPKTAYPPMDKEEWTKVIQTCKSYGYNFMRFHSWCPPSAAFEAADDAGFLFQVELPFWSMDVPHYGAHPVRDEYLKQELYRILDTYGNHPSLGLVAMGNESSGTLDVLVKAGQERDQRPLYRIESGVGDFQEGGSRGCVGPRTDWNRDITTGWIAGDNTEANKREGAPIFMHEMGQWQMYPNFKELEKYTGNMKPYNYEFYRDSLKARGMFDQAEEFFQVSGQFMTSLYKEETEASFRTNPLGGFQVLEARDYTGQGTAIVGWLDPFWDSKGLITPVKFREFCDNTVCLAWMSQRVWTTGNTFLVHPEIAHYGPTDVESDLKWEIRDVKGGVLKNGIFPSKKIKTGQITRFEDIAVPLSEVKAPARLILKISGVQKSNQWNFWVYPEEQAAPPKNVKVVYSFDEKTKELLKSGERVLLFSSPKEGVIPCVRQMLGPESLRANPVVKSGANAFMGSFTPCFWNLRLFNQIGTLSILCDPQHPALAGFPTERYSDWQWADLLGRFSGSDSFKAAGADKSYYEDFEKRVGDVTNRSKVIILDEAPSGYRPIVQMIDNYERNSKLGLIFEVKSGAGKLLVCGMDLDVDAEKRPAARQLKSSLLSYVAGGQFNPQSEFSAELLDRLLLP